MKVKSYSRPLSVILRLWVRIQALRSGISFLAVLGRTAGDEREVGEVILSTVANRGLLYNVDLVSLVNEVAGESFAVVGRVEPCLCKADQHVFLNEEGIFFSKHTVPAIASDLISYGCGRGFRKFHTVEKNDRIGFRDASDRSQLLNVHLVIHQVAGAGIDISTANVEEVSVMASFIRSAVRRDGIDAYAICRCLVASVQERFVTER